MKVLDLFSGIGGLSLGLRWAGFETIGFCEIEPFCRRVLSKHWPGVFIHDDIKTLTAELILDRCGRPDIIVGGFPCQDISGAGKGEGIGTAEEPTERSGLWWQMHRIISALRSEWVLIENVDTLRTRGIDEIASALEALNYTVWPVVVGAWAVGAPHERNRCWIVAYSDDISRRRQQQQRSGNGTWTWQQPDRDSQAMDDTTRERIRGLSDPARFQPDINTNRAGEDVANATGERREGRKAGQRSAAWTETGGGGSEEMANADGARLGDGGIAEVSNADFNHGGESLANAARERVGEQADEAFTVTDQRRQGHELSNRGAMAYPVSERLQIWSSLTEDFREELTATSRSGHRWPAGPGCQQYDWEHPRILPHANRKQAIGTSVSSGERSKGSAQPGMGRATNGLPRGMVGTRRAKLKALGNAVVPQVVEQIGRAILELRRVLVESSY